MTQKINFHTHTNFCDGKNTPEEIVLAAIEKGFSAIGFSSHSYGFDDLPYGKRWHITSKSDGQSGGAFERHKEYATTIRALKEKYSDKIKIFCGFESDYIPDVWIPKKENYRDINPDYLIGSVHYVLKREFDTSERTHTHYSADADASEVKWGIELFYKNDGRQAVLEYFDLERQMIEKGDFEILGHPDLIRLRNTELHFFDEKAEWYINEIKDFARFISKHDLIVEINSGAIARGKMDDFYPSYQFLEFLHERKVPIAINSDAHSIEHLDAAFDRAISQAKKIGYTELVYPKIGTVEI